MLNDADYLSLSCSPASKRNLRAPLGATHHQPIAVMLDLMNPERAGRWPGHLDGRHSSMKPEGRRRCKTMAGGYGTGRAVQPRRSR